MELQTFPQGESWLYVANVGDSRAVSWHPVEDSGGASEEIETSYVFWTQGVNLPLESVFILRVVSNFPFVFLPTPKLEPIYVPVDAVFGFSCR